MDNNPLKKYDGYINKGKFGILCKVDANSISYPLHRHDYFEFEYLKKGKILYEVNGVSFELTAGDAFAVSPADLHKITVTEPIELYNLCILYREAAPSVQKLISSVDFPFISKPHDSICKSIESCFLSAAYELENPQSFDADALSSYISIELINLFRSMEAIKYKENSYAYVYVAKAMNFISENLCEPITLTDVSQHVNLSTNYFSKIFTEINGRGFLKYLTDERIALSKKMLELSDMSILDISYSCGFASFSAFSRAFKVLTGISPSEYRKALRYDKI